MPPSSQRLDVLVSRQKPWGRPDADFDPVLPGLTKVGGEDGQDITELFKLFRSDVEVLGRWLSAQSLELEQSYEVFAARRGRLRRRIEKLLETLRSITIGEALAEKSIRFSDVSSIDMVNTTAQYDATRGVVFLPFAAGAYKRISTKEAAVISLDSPDGGRVHSGDPLACLNSASTDAWLVETPPGEAYQAVIRLSSLADAAGPSDDFRVNRVFIDPVLPCFAAVELSPDGYNWVEVVSGAQISGPCEYSFTPLLAGYVRLTLGRGVAGIKRLLLYESDFDRAAVLYGQPIEIPQASQVDRLSLILDADIPEGASIEPTVEVQTYDLNGVPSGWTEVLPVGGLYRLLDGVQASFDLQGDGAERFSGGGWRLPTAGFIVSSDAPLNADLYRGINQVEASAMLDYEALAVSDQTLVDASPGRFKNEQARSAVFSCRETELALSDAELVRGFYDADKDVYSTPLVRASVGGGADTWWGIVLREADGTASASGTPILYPGYFYRFTTWVKPPTRGIYRGSAWAWMHGAGKLTSACPFTIVVNGRVIFSGRTAYTSGAFADLLDSEKTLYWPFESDWNKVEVYVYRPAQRSQSDLSLQVEGQSPVSVALPRPLPIPACGESSSGQVLLLQPNFFEEPWEVISDPNPMVPGSIWDVILSDDERGRLWTWLKRDNTWDILLSSNPRSRRAELSADPAERNGNSAYAVRIDGLHASDALRFRLRTFMPSYGSELVDAGVVRLKFALRGSVGRTPVLRGYTLRFYGPGQ